MAIFFFRIFQKGQKSRSTKTAAKRQKHIKNIRPTKKEYQKQTIKHIEQYKATITKNTKNTTREKIENYNSITYKKLRPTKNTQTTNNTTREKNVQIQSLTKRVAKLKFSIYCYADVSTRVLADFVARLPLLVFCHYAKRQ